MGDIGWEPNWTHWTNDLDDAKASMAQRCCAIEMLTIGAVAYDPRQQQPLPPRSELAADRMDLRSIAADPLAELARLIGQDDPFLAIQPPAAPARLPSEWKDWPGSRLPASERQRVSEALTQIRKVIETYGGGNQAIGPHEARAAFAKVDALATAGLEAVKP